MEWRERELIEVVRRLAAPAEDQRAYLRQSESYPSLDELALELDDMLKPLPPESPWLAAARALDAHSTV